VGDVQTDAGELDHRGGVRAPRVCAQCYIPQLDLDISRGLTKTRESLCSLHNMKIKEAREK
jgi:hypothetical protein